jgi:poly(3-hydroxybutyrate) depolymerase
MRIRLAAALVIIAVALSFGLATASPTANQVPKLGTYSIQGNRIFVAGISSGGAMAVQLQVAYSGGFKGGAIYAGLPYYCAKDNPGGVATCSFSSPAIDVADLVKITKSWAHRELIDPVQNLQGQPIYLWSGLFDTTVNQAAMNALQSYYQDLGADVFRYDKDFGAGHGWESPYGPIQCGLAVSPFINVCYDQNEVPPPFDWFPQVYDSEEVWLNQLVGPLKPKNDGTLTGSVLPFDQSEFAAGGRAASISMANKGYVFVPQACVRGAACGLILALHGCLQHYGAIGRSFIDDSGINQWADTNNLVVLYPQTIASTANLGTGCWDWWGYLNDPDYAQKSGPQMKALYSMVLRVSGHSGMPN